MKKTCLFIFVIIGINNLSAQCTFRTIGHRGGSSYDYPENTIVALKHGFMIDGLYAAEVDVRKTSDNVLMLIHDYYVERTTNGHGDIENLSSTYIKSLDAGSWKGKQFSGEKVPTLKEAILLAQQYNKKLYLNMKVFEPELIASTLKETNAAEDIIMLDPNDTTEIRIYHELMPNTPLVYFGEPPSKINDTCFYTFLKKNGVIAAELYAGDILDTSIKWTKEYKNNLEKYGINIWSYTVNNLEYMQKLKDFGIQGIESDRPYVAYEFFCNGEHVGYFPEKRITGQWDFLQKNLMGTKGSQMIVRGDTGISGQNVKFGKTSDFKIPLIENKDVDIIKVPAFDSAHYLTFYSNIAPQGSPGGLVCDNNYTLLMDILKPASCKDYISLYQSSCVNEDDGDLFIETKSKGVGILYNYKGIINDSVWYRLAFVFDLPNEKIDEYIDGNHVGTIILENAMDGRFCINNNWGIQPSNLFSDNDGETDNLYVSSIQIRDYVMSKEEIQSLGGVKYNKLSDTIIINQADCPVYSITNKESDVCSGNKATLKINGELNVNYKWQMNSGSGWYDLQENIYTDDTSPDLIIDHVSKEMNNNRFRCIISNDCKVISDEILLGIKAEPQIIQQPISVNVRAGVDTAIDVIATGIELTYQWQIKGETSSWFNLNDNISYSGAKTEKLKIRDVLKESDGNTYRCIIKDSCGIELITEHALLTINTTGTNINRNLRSSILIIQNKGDLKLNFPDYEKVYKYSVCNIIGQVLHEGTVRKSGIVDIHLNTGIYLLKVSDNMHSETIKFVVNEQ